METTLTTIALVRSDLPLPLIEDMVRLAAQYLEQEVHVHRNVNDSTYVHVRVERSAGGE